MTLGIEQRNLQPDHLAAAGTGGHARQLLVRVDTLHRSQHASRRDQVPACRDEVGEVGETARDHHREQTGRPPMLGASRMHDYVLQSELNRRLPQKGGLLLIAVIQSYLPFGTRDREWNSWHAPA